MGIVGGFSRRITRRSPPGRMPRSGLLERMAEMIGFSDIRNVARFFGVSEKTLEHWYYEFVERQRKRRCRRRPEPIRSLGIDALSLKKSTASSARC